MTTAYQSTTSTAPTAPALPPGSPRHAADRPPLPEPHPDWVCRWSGQPGGSVVLDLGLQPAADAFPLPTDPVPDPEHPLRMVISSVSGLVQLETDPTTPEEPRGVEPAALVAQSEAAVAQSEAAGFVRPGTRVLEHPSPHGGSWVDQLGARGLVEVDEGPAELVVDIFGMMHAADQRTALLERAAQLTDDGILLMQFHTVAAIIRSGIWNALRHGHFAYYSTPALVAMAREVGLVAIGCWEYPLYGGTIMLAFAKQSESHPTQTPDVTTMVARELAEGAIDPHHAASLGRALDESVSAIEAYLAQTQAEGLVVGGYCAASRASALLRCAHITTDQVVALADASVAKHGRTMPGNRIPIVSPAGLVALHPDRVLLFVPDLLDEVRAALPEIEANGGRWVVLDPMPREIEPL
ncbi:transferase [Sanguibacter antarcticus]|uniref:Putative zinc binding protein n=1 Tax=Sanguibacter antarcticus TaxID=372484 RepID=A0A2A9E2D3_9MICO|nr:transferase [Sanguibacter antarcticus]PFG32340.1 putative zinc binding protein [Sanguibacter antarcticus]